MTLTAPLFTLFGQEISGRDLILLGGGLFLLWKSVHEIHNSLEGGKEGDVTIAAVATFGAVIAQIAVIDIIFSLDSVITAVGVEMLNLRMRSKRQPVELHKRIPRDPQ